MNVTKILVVGGIALAFVAIAMRIDVVRNFIFGAPKA
jgi:hypothetical protein